mmetsp:Transcript_6534/g.10991  ORF Transcript_6534/g.10991 Transcript_6534/m.10991 type:complete len:290 (+) Transcript_6534:46-915(+)
MSLHKLFLILTQLLCFCLIQGYTHVSLQRKSRVPALQLLHDDRYDDQFNIIGNEDYIAPKSPIDRTHDSKSNAKRALLSTLVAVLAPSVSVADSAPAPYVDNAARFSLNVPPSWLVMPRKTPTPTMLQFQVEEVLFVANSFAEGASLSVTRTNAARLLKDFDIEWWFAPLNTLADVGSPDLVTRLLILQRQGEFEKRTTPSELKSSAFVPISSDGRTVNDDGKKSKGTPSALTFDFITPLAEGVNRRTLGKGYLREGYLYVLWISGLSNVIEGDYAVTLNEVIDSFRLV